MSRSKCDISRNRGVVGDIDVVTVLRSKNDIVIDGGVLMYVSYLYNI